MKRYTTEWEAKVGPQATFILIEFEIEKLDKVRDCLEQIRLEFPNYSLCFRPGRIIEVRMIKDKKGTRDFFKN